MVQNDDAKMNERMKLVAKLASDQPLPIKFKKNDNCILAQKIPFLAYFGRISQEFLCVKSNGHCFKLLPSKLPMYIGWGG